MTVRPDAPDSVIATAREILPDWTSTGAPEPLSGGNLNFVWRLPGIPDSVVLKFAPPYVASAPEIALSQERVRFEIDALRVLGSPDELLIDFTGSPDCGPVRLLGHTEDRTAYAMEDLGGAVALDAWLDGDAASRGAPSPFVGLGGFIGALHRSTRGRSDLASRFDNADVQRTRAAVQYGAVGDWLDAQGVGERARHRAAAALAALGERLTEPGVCWVMGDLWPPSVLSTPGGVRLIDWEFTHYGRPLQDVAHLVAHLWMHGHGRDGSRAADVLDAFLVEYRDAGGFEAWTPKEHELAGRHVAAEILQRAIGPFRGAGRYAEGDASLVEDAVSVALGWATGELEFTALVGAP